MSNLIEKILLEANYKFDEQIPEKFSFLYRDNTKFYSPDLKWKCVKILQNYLKDRSKLKTVKLNKQLFIPVNGSTDKAKIPFVIKYFNSYYILDGLNLSPANLYQGIELIDVKLLDLDTLNIGLDRKTSFS